MSNAVQLFQCIKTGTATGGSVPLLNIFQSKLKIMFEAQVKYVQLVNSMPERISKCVEVIKSIVRRDLQSINKTPASQWSAAPTRHSAEPHLSNGTQHPGALQIDTPPRDK
ncbi:Hypothetical_protein [Hexamita inflata]|uniref:Hypothetical_protein n=1 Tax=Hexamita inflata TaxID=28002 RepID=A0AA86VFH9_9EUKA|nr:Hypothetical protein HINF_LOCUS52908 [Hexamita inflata]